MSRISYLFTLFFCFIPVIASSQAFVSTVDLFSRTQAESQAGHLKINQDPSIDTLLSRYIMINENTYNDLHRFGMDGFRIQIYSSSNRTAREESNKVRAQFISRFPDIVSYILYAEPGYFKIRVGDFRTKTDAMKIFMQVSREFPDAYLVPDVINFPDVNTK
jgi:hypothetical protein